VVALAWITCYAHALVGGGTLRAAVAPGRCVPCAAIVKAAEATVDKESLSWYLSSIGQHDLLEREDEQLLSMDVQELLRWQSVRSQLEAELNRPINTTEWSRAVGFEEVASAAAEEPDSAQLLHHRCFDQQLRELTQAKETMINSNLRLVVRIAKGYAGRGLGIQDLIQEGTLGLITAVDKFDPQHASRAKFSSYASWWIKQRVRRAVGKSGTIRLPARMPSLLHNIAKAREAFQRTHGRDPSNHELASAVDISVDRLRLVLSASRGPVSLDSQLRRGGRAADDQRTLGDTIPDLSADPAQHVEARLRRQTLATALHSVLPPEEHAVICSCYNLLEGRQRELSYQEIGERFGRTSQWVEKVEERALKRLKGRSYLRNLLQTRGVAGSSADS